MTDFAPDRPHPLGITDNAEWEVVLTRRAELYLEERARRETGDREPSKFHIALAILGSIVVAVCLFSAVWL